MIVSWSSVDDWSVSNNWGSMNSLDEGWLYSLDNCWLSNNCFVTKWFSLDLSVESIDWISFVVNCTLESVWINEWVVSFNNISISWFVLWLAISGQTVLDIIGEWVLWIVVVIFSDFVDDWLSDLCDDLWGNICLLDISWLSYDCRGNGFNN